MSNKLCSTGSGMSRKHWWLWSTLGLLALYTLLLVSRCTPIEQDIQARTNAMLTEKGYAWAQASLNKSGGRDVRISGIAPSEAARDDAILTAENVYGARTVTHNMTLKQYNSPTFGLSNDDGKTTLTGSFPKQALIDKALQSASDNFGAENVINRMELSEGVSSPSWLSASLAVLPFITSMTDAVFEINDESSTLKGTFHTDEEKQAFLTLAGKKLGGTFQESTVVVPLGPTPEELAEIARKAEEAEEARLAEELMTEELEVARIAEEKRKAEEAKAARLAEEKRIAEELEAARIAEEKRKAEEAEAARLAKEKRITEELEAARIAEEKRKAEEAEAARLAEEKRIAEALEAARIAEEKRKAEEARTAELAAKRLEEVKSCQAAINNAMNGNTILFATSSSSIDPKSYPLLNTIATTIRRCGDMVLANGQLIEISGHTDSRGADEMNLILSDNRAKSVRSYLLEQGVRSSVLISKGYGESNPVADNGTASGRKQNRRIQFTIQ